MSDGDGQALDADDEHMRIGRADVVLDDEARRREPRGGFEPRMIEFETARALEPAHEGGDEWLILGVGGHR